MKKLLVAFVLVLVLYFVLFPPSVVSPSRAVSSVSLSALLAAPAGTSVLGRPSLTAAFIDQVLAAAHSPAVGLGKALYQDSVSSGIDDAFALAFFRHESRYGTLGVAVATHSLGNIRCTRGWPSCIAGYRAYASFAEGAADWFHLLSTEYVSHGLSTVELIVPVYAPSRDHNNVSAYIAAVLSAVSVWRSGQVVV